MMKIIVGWHLRNNRYLHGKKYGKPYFYRVNYMFFCPYDNIKAGDFVVVDNSKGDYSIVLVRATEDIDKPGDVFKYTPVPYRHVLFKVPVKNYLKYRNDISEKERNMLWHYELILERETKKGKLKKRRTIEDILTDQGMDPEDKNVDYDI